MSWMKRMSRLVIVGLLLAGCSGQAAGDEGAAAPSDTDISGEVGSGNTNGPNTQRLRTDYADNALSQVSQLALGTFMLEDTNKAVDPEMAADLLPYWQLYLTMMNSDTAAQQEKDSLISDIQGIMSEDQISYIAGLELTQEDLMAMGSQLDLAGRTSSLDQESSDQGTRGNGRGMPPDGMPEGMGPGEGGFAGGPGGGADGQAMDPELLATMQAERGNFTGGGGPGANRMEQPLIQALIELLESKTAS